MTLELEQAILRTLEAVESLGGGDIEKGFAPVLKAHEELVRAALEALAAQGYEADARRVGHPNAAWSTASEKARCYWMHRAAEKLGVPYTHVRKG